MLVNFIDVEDALDGAVDVVARRLVQIEDDVFNVLTDIASLGQRGRVGDDEGDIQETRQRSSNQRFSGSRGTDKQDVGLLDFDFVVLSLSFALLIRFKAFVVVVYGNGQLPLSQVLADDILVQKGLDFGGRWHLLVAPRYGLRLCIFTDDIKAKLDAFGTDIHIRAGDNLIHFSLGLVTERAGEAGWI